MVDGVGAFVEAELSHGEVQRLHRLHRLADNPAVDRQHRCGRLDMRAATYAVGLAESRRVPQLRGEVAMALHPLFVELDRSEEHTSELQSLMRTSYAVSCLK